MINSVIYDPYELIDKLFSLQKLGYIFRGHANPTWKLTPSIFRLKNQKFLSESYPIKYDTYYWYFSREIKRIVELWAKIKFDKYIPQALMRIFDLYVFIMKYNFGLNKFHNENSDSILHDPNQTTLIRPQRDWENEQTFIDFVGNTLQTWLNIYNLDGSLRFKAKPHEELTIIEEPFPQHYGFPTAALDFSKNPLKSLWFGISNNSSCCFNIFAYKQIEGINNSPIKIIENKNEKNTRAIKQEGCFVYFTRPCSFYVSKTRFPSLGDYDSDIEYGLIEESFKIERIFISNNKKTIPVINELFKKEDINEKSLGLQ